MNYLIVIIVTILIFTNAITDAPNAIATLVGTQTMKFKNAAKLSAICNFIGIIVMSLVNFSVANCISSMVNLTDEINGNIVLISAMLSVIIFSLIALLYGIPTSETHGLVAGLTGASMAMYGVAGVDFAQWKNVIIGLVLSVFGTFILSSTVIKILSNTIKKTKDSTIKNFQIISTIGMSFMHGAQDGQKFIGILILYISLAKSNITKIECFGVIIFTAIIMGIGVSIGGKKIVENIGSNITKLTIQEGVLSDITSVSILIISSIFGLPVSTSHIKTMSIIGISANTKNNINMKSFIDICKAWILTFPVCCVIAFILVKVFNKI